MACGRTGQPLVAGRSAFATNYFLRDVAEILDPPPPPPPLFSLCCEFHLTQLLDPVSPEAARTHGHARMVTYTPPPLPPPPFPCTPHSKSWSFTNDFAFWTSEVEVCHTLTFPEIVYWDCKTASRRESFRGLEYIEPLPPPPPRPASPRPPFPIPISHPTTTHWVYSGQSWTAVLLEWWKCFPFTVSVSVSDSQREDWLSDCFRVGFFWETKCLPRTRTRNPPPPPPAHTHRHTLTRKNSSQGLK